MSDRATLAKFQSALPFWVSFTLVPVAMVSAAYGGWTLLLLPLIAWQLFSVVDALLGLNTDNADLDATEEDLLWYRRLTTAWVPVQAILLFGMIAYATRADHLSASERVFLFMGIGVITGTIGINYSHELMHQKNRFERMLADILLAMVMYSHFRSEHLLVHHRYVGTPRDAVSARYNEGIHKFFARIIPECWRSAFQAEKAMLARMGLPWTDTRNPFWTYWALQSAMLALAFLIGGWAGVGLFLVQAVIAITQLELVNYIEHYGLTRKHLGDGRYEHVQPHHSWNAAHKATNWLLINLQRHSDHHYKPDRRFPLLQTHPESVAPQLPRGYPLMTIAALVPPLWRRIMNPRVRRWREAYYPEITDWRPYNRAETPMPR